MPCAPKKILIVDDDATIAETTARTLERMNYRIVGIASTGEAAVNETINSHPDVVIMDVVLGGTINGIEASCQIGEFLNVPVIFMTGHRNISTAMQANKRAILHKPFTSKELQEAIEAVLTNSR
jgi:DNA-binding response OmpR family regulator